MASEATEVLEPYRKYLKGAGGLAPRPLGLRFRRVAGGRPDLAERVGKTVPAVASLLRRGLAELRTALKVED